METSSSVQFELGGVFLSICLAFLLRLLPFAQKATTQNESSPITHHKTAPRRLIPTAGFICFQNQEQPPSFKAARDSKFWKKTLIECS